jgi:hypothetical protein
MKTTKLLAMSMALCLGATSAFGQVNSISLAGGDDCNNATPIPPSAVGIDGNGRVTCIVSDNFGANSSGSTPSCWDVNVSADVWFEFTVPAGPDTCWWTISTDNGINDFNTDMQLALLSSCGTIIACNEDLGTETESANTFSSGITQKLDPGVYYIQADVYGTTPGDTAKFSLTIFRNKRPVNSCISSAYSVDYGYDNFGNSFDGDGWFIYNPYTYAGPTDAEDASWDPTRTLITGTDDLLDIQGSNSDNVNDGTYRIYNDVWLKFTYNPNDPEALISVYPKNGWPRYGLEWFEGTPSFPLISGSCDTIISGLNRLGGSLPDGFLESGRQGDEAAGNFWDHPRVKFHPNSLDDNTFAQTIYLRVYQYTRAAADPANLAAPPSEGLFKVTFEKVVNCAASSGCGGDNDCCKGTALNDGCQDPGANVHVQLSGLSNAGMYGGLDAAGGGTVFPAGRDHEAATYNVANGTTRADHNCSGTEVITGGKTGIVNNNSILYWFTVEDAIQSVDISGIDTLLAVTINDSIVFVQNPLSPGDSIAIPSDEVSAVLALCSGITVSPGSNIPSGPLCPDSIVTVCGADVKFQFSNLNYCGVNGAGAEFFVVAVNPDAQAQQCANPTGAGNGNVVASFGELSTFQGSVCDTCLTMGPSAFYLPSGEYCLVIDGERGSLVDFDLDMWIDYNIPGTVIPCGTPCGTQTKSLTAPKANNFDKGVRPNYLAPHPAEGFTNFGFTTPVDGNVLYAITDINGRVVDSGNFAATEGENAHRFDVADLNTGLYVITLQINGVRTQVKLMKN